MKYIATKLKSAHIIIALMFILTNQSNTQIWLNQEQNISSNKKNFYEMKSEFENYWVNHDYTEKGKGWKQFKRWQWFWEQRVYPTGEFPNPMQTFIARKFEPKKNQNRIQSIGDWVELGPSTSNGGYYGIGRINCVKENPSNSNYLYAGAAGGGLWISTNAGSSWFTTTDELGSIGISDIAISPSNSNIIYIATGDADASDNYSVGVMKSTDAGNSWSTTGLNWTQSQARVISKLLIHPTNSNILYAAASNGIWKTTDAGANWSQIYSAGAIRDLEFKPGNPSVIYASRITIIRSTDDGANWTTLTSGLPSSGVQRIAITVSPANSNYIYAIMSNSNSGFLGFYRSTDTGNNWTLMANSPNLLGWNTNGSDTGGQGWYDLAIAANQTNIDEVLIGGVNIWKTTNGGTNWTCVSNWTSNVHADQHDLWFAPNSSRLYVGNDGGVYKTTNSGTNWTWLGNGIKNTQFYRIGASATNSSLVIGGAQDNGTKLRNGTTWTDIIGGDGMECIIDHSNANIMYGELYYGQIRKSTNGGISFSSMSLPSEYSSNLGAWVTPYVMNKNNSSNLYVGYRNVWKSTNGGTSWTQISNFTSGSLTLLHIAPSNSNYIYASTGTSSLKMTTNGGSTWSSYSFPVSLYMTYLAIHQSDPLKIWATFSGYSSGNKVFYSTNGGASWTNISGSLPNVPANCIVYQNDFNNRVYVGTDVGVYYRDDNSNGWVDFNTNLPNVVVNELEIHYATNKLRAATYGRGLWEAEISANAITLSPPSLSSPLNNATNIAINPTLSWSTVNNATSYIIQYSTNSSFSTYSETTSTSNTKQISNLSYNTLYYWRVKATNGNISSDWSSVFSFTTQQLTLSAPTLYSPSNNASNVTRNNLLFSWSSVSNAEGYKYQVSTASNFSSYNQFTSTTNTIYVSGFASRTTYYWRVKAYNGSIESNWSSTFKFKTGSNKEIAYDNDNIIDKSEPEIEFSIQPNPVVNNCDIILSLPEGEQREIEVYNIFGEKVMTIPLSSNELINYKINFSRNGLPSGAYILLIKTQTNLYRNYLIIE